MKKLLLAGAVVLATIFTAGAQDKKEVKMLENEKWWGSVTDLGNIMPFDSETVVRFNHQTQNFNNQTTPLLVSDKGRYIWSDSPFTRASGWAIPKTRVSHKINKLPPPTPMPAKNPSTVETDSTTGKDSNIGTAHLPTK